MRLYIMVGPPASGKSTYAKNVLMPQCEAPLYISRDEIRFSMLRKNDNYFSKEKKVYDEFVRRIKEAFDNEDEYISDVIADATHINWTSRRKLLAALGMLSGEYSWVDVVPIVINTPVKECMERNAKRYERERVPDDGMRQMNRSRTHPKDDPFKYKEIIEIDGTKDFRGEVV